ncbi:MAG: CHAT domain-containing protein/tetratricopeptide (TPR) repeat protein, partial [Candidatus Paceibacteria bacterium]
VSVWSNGYLLEAREILERVSATTKSASPTRGPDVARTHINLGTVLFMLGDTRGAFTLFESSLLTLEREVPSDSPAILMAKQGLAATLFELGDPYAALDLFAEILAVYEDTMPEGSLPVLLIRNNIAEMLRETGDLESARELLEEVLADFDKLSVPNGVDRLGVELSLALTLVELEELGTSRLHLERLLESSRSLRTGFADSLELLARSTLCKVLVALGESDLATVELHTLSNLLLEWNEQGLFLAPREALEHVSFVQRELSLLLSLCSTAELGPNSAELFALVEAFRSSASGGIVPDFTLNAEDRRDRARLLVLRSEVQALSAAAGTDNTARSDFQMSVLERDRKEAAFRKRMRQAGNTPPQVTAPSLAECLGEGEYAVAYRVYVRTTLEQELEVREAAMLAFVVLDDSRVVRVELGSLDKIKQAVSAWREAIGAPIGVKHRKAPQGDEQRRAATNVLRELVLDPILAVGEARERMHVALDGPLHLVPLDALLWNPVAEQQIEVKFWVTFADLIAPRALEETSPSLLALGGIDFGENSDISGSTAPGQWETLQDLPATRQETETLAELFEGAHGIAPALLLGSEASKKSFQTLAINRRYLHLATHGYISDERVRSWTDTVLSEGATTLRAAGDPVIGMAPMTLCGLALAGANHGSNTAERMLGRLTAEEVAGLDLRACELAVLSACETNVGISRAGQGLHSLHGALHTAGVRSTLTSLWTVDDKATLKLMTEFYRLIWVEHIPKAQALRKAKELLWKQRYPIRDWSGWVLIGDPN